MIGNAHLAFGTGSFLIATSLAGHTPGIIELAAVALGSLIPDADHPRSKIGRWLPGISHFFYYIAGGHRGITHSALLVIPMLIFAGWLMQEHNSQLGWFSSGALQDSIYGVGYLAMLAFSFGFLSHLLGDLMTTEGLRLFWPLPLRLQPSPLRSESALLNLFAWSILLTGITLQFHNFTSSFG